MDRLFEETLRTNRNPAAHLEGRFRFLNRVAGPFWERIRSVLEEWLVALPADNRRDLINRFRSDDDRVSSGAFWELYQAEALRRAGFTLTLHPVVSGSTRKPDFLAERSDGTFYLEATVASSSNEGVAARKRQDWLYDEINSVPSPLFWLDVHVKARAQSHAPTKRIKSDLAGWLASLDPDRVRAVSDAGRLDALPEIEWEVGGWRLFFRAIAKSVEMRGKPAPTIGIYSPEGGYIDAPRPVRQALREKSSRYGRLDRPYLVAVLVESMFVRDPDIISSLFGSVAMRFATNADDPEFERTEDGAWFGPRGPTGTRVSGVIIANNLAPWSLVKREPWAILNPWAARPLTAALGWRTTTADLTTGSLLASPPSITAAQLFELPEDWPGSEDPFETRSRFERARDP